MGYLFGLSVLVPWHGIGIADDLAGPAFARPIISAVAACEHAVLQFCSIMCGLCCVIVVTTHC